MRLVFAIRQAYLKQQKGIVVEQKFWKFSAVEKCGFASRVNFYYCLKV